MNPTLDFTRVSSQAFVPPTGLPEVVARIPYAPDGDRIGQLQVSSSGPVRFDVRVMSAEADTYVEVCAPIFLDNGTVVFPDIALTLKDGDELHVLGTNRYNSGGAGFNLYATVWVAGTHVTASPPPEAIAPKAKKKRVATDTPAPGTLV